MEKHFTSDQMQPTIVVTGIDDFEYCGSASPNASNASSKRTIAITVSTSVLICVVVVVVIATFLFQRSRRYRNYLMLQLKQSKTPNIVIFAPITSFSCYQSFHFNNINESASPKFIRLNLLVRENK